MTEPKPTYTTDRDKPVAPAQDDRVRDYLWKRRELLIAELRYIDRALGRAQTVPERVR